jgi:hypothetical protein
MDTARFVKNCYLCGEAIDPTSETDDHVIPKTLKTQKQPKVKGFDYGGVLPAHQRCNNEFGPEKYVDKALQLIAALHDPNCWSIHQHKDDPSIQVLALRSECFKGITRRDLEYFKLIDGRGRDISEISDPSFFSGKTKTNPWRDATFATLAVLTKSAAALLISRHLHRVPTRWRVLASLYIGATEAFDSETDELLGNTKPFDSEVTAPIRCVGDSYNWFIPLPSP